MAREREKEKGKKRKKSEPLWGEGELKEAGEVEITPVESKDESEIEELKRRLDNTQEALTSIKEVGDKMGGVEDKMGELSSIYEAFISKYTPLEAERREGILETGGERTFSVEEDLMILEWIDYLLEIMPRDEVGKRLSYLLGVGWLDEALFERAINFLHGLKDFSEEPAIEEKWRTSANAYVKSLLFIESIKGRPVNISKVRAAIFKAKAIWKEENLEV